MSVLRPGTSPPAGTATEEFLLEPLRTSHVQLDYEAVMETRQRLRDWSLSEWPADDFTLQGNLDDLAEHQREHDEGVAFTYTILSLDRSTCLGCVYVRPLAPRFLPEHERATGERPDAAVRVAFWVRESRLADDLDRRVVRHLRAWFGEEWDLDRAVMYTSDREQRQQQILTEDGLRLAYRVPVSGGNLLAYIDQPG
jgi:hypothetical protein